MSCAFGSGSGSSAAPTGGVGQRRRGRGGGLARRGGGEQPRDLRALDPQLRLELGDLGLVLLAGRLGLGGGVGERLPQVGQIDLPALALGGDRLVGGGVRRVALLHEPVELDRQVLRARGLGVAELGELALEPLDLDGVRLVARDRAALLVPGRAARAR